MHKGRFDKLDRNLEILKSYFVNNIKSWANLCTNDMFFVTLQDRLTFFWQGCTNTLVSSVQRFTIRCRGSGAKLSPKAMVPFPIMVNSGLANPRRRTLSNEERKIR